ncbi:MULTISPECIES: FAD-dependent monooxygenase [Streptomyces]|uniref:FAD-dependent monooxygenase n=1 Tax=Streptomyces morookaense TaxID=1970 RepID=A0A7Y7E5Y9_STRMO|nr:MULTISPECIES: FAD-dependent monooxygenase [Streptomyces]MCC2274270.1 FAD-dependent monooxygenase [Streptomyces sp. ET3-23]NVK76652.1 FAD-dependent monooxygenase [Streptomyces morookaense]
METDVIVAGAGPTGLMLANELGLAGIRALVVERLPARSGQSKALGLQPRTAEVLEMRGWLEPLHQRAVGRLEGGHFAGIPLDYGVFGTRFPYQIGIPQPRVEEYLEQRLAGYGIPVLRGRELTGFRQDASGVTVTVDGPEGPCPVRAAYLVGADGSRSRVRKELGVAFPGRDGRVSLAVADVELDDPGGILPEDWQLPSFAGRDGGGAFLLPLGGGVHRMLFGGPEQQGLDRDAPVTEEEVRVALHREHGDALRLKAVRWASRFTDASRQAAQYVVGRVLLAGDAAHIHLPAGGQGLNLGMQDAVNLGWKLAACVRGRAPEDLLDTYHSERHPVGARVLENTRAQGVLMLPDTDVQALRSIVTGLLETPEGNRRIAGMISGLDIRYPMPGAPEHPLLGRHIAGVPLGTGRGLLLTSGAQPVPEALIRPWQDRVDRTAADPATGIPGGAGAAAVLLRPDGHVCWAGPADGEGLGAALGRWFGDPQH